MPSQKKKCQNCGNFIFVRTSPIDEKKILLKENQIEQIEEQWAIKNGVHNEYLTEISLKNELFKNKKETISENFGHTPSDSDVNWGLLNDERLKHAQDGNWGLYRNTTLRMGDFVKKEKRYTHALNFYFETCYLDINGPNNNAINLNIERFTPDLHSLAPGVINLIIKMKNNLNISNDELESMFLAHTKIIQQSLKLPISPQTAWDKLKSEANFK